MKKKVIIADDDKDIVTVVTMMLEDAGYEVTSTANSHVTPTVLDILPDVLLLDIWMAGVDGRDVCKFLKSQEKTKDLPIIMFSANPDIKKIAKKAGADDFIAKPFEMDALLEKVAQYV